MITALSSVFMMFALIHAPNEPIARGGWANSDSAIRGFSA
jgi:hypothetical protein